MRVDSKTSVDLALGNAGERIWQEPDCKKVSLQKPIHSQTVK